MKFRNAIKNSLFIKSLSLAKSNPGKIGLMVLFDISFLISFFYVLPALAGYFAQNLAVSQAPSFMVVIAVLSLAYNLLALFVYSFFKFGVLDFIKSLFGKTDFSFARLGRFYLLNIILFFPAYILFNALLGSVKESYRPFVFVTVGAMLFILLYFIINLSDSLFYHGASIKESIKKGFSIAFTKISAYKEIALFMITSFFALWLLFLGSGYLVRVVASRNYILYLSAYSYFRQASIIVFDVAAYFIILINRISFYAVAMKTE